MNSKRGFTLIELLVVLAIAAIFLSFVITSMNTGRNRAKDARTQQALGNALAQAEILNGTNGNYNGICSAVSGGTLSADVLSILTTAKASDPKCTADALSPTTKIAIYASSEAGSGYLCVDSSGNQRISSTMPAEGVCK